MVERKRLRAKVSHGSKRDGERWEGTNRNKVEKHGMNDGMIEKWKRDRIGTESDVD